MEENKIKYDVDTKILTVNNPQTASCNEIQDITKDNIVKIINVSDTGISQFPDWMRQVGPKVIFSSNNNFSTMPDMCEYEGLTTLALKNCGIKARDENVLPPSMKWLMLTGNTISQLPNSIGNLQNLQKLALSGNTISQLPDSMQQCRDIALLRVSANNLTKQPPVWIHDLPKLKWWSHGGNDFQSFEGIEDLTINTIDYGDIVFGDKIGQSPSSEVFKATVNIDGKEKLVAVKIFRGGLTSDGYPEDDRRFSIMAGKHPNLIKILGSLTGHPNDRSGLILSYVPEYKSLGLPPSIDTCTRDTFPDDQKLELRSILTSLLDVAKAAAHLHSKKIMHGDIYAHNTLTKTGGSSFLGDFGAASYYKGLDNERGFQAMDVGAFGCMVDDLLGCYYGEQDYIYKSLKGLGGECTNPYLIYRPSFNDVVDQLGGIKHTHVVN